MASVELKLKISHQKWRWSVAKYGLFAMKYICLVVPINEKRFAQIVISWCLRGSKVSV